MKISPVDTMSITYNFLRSSNKTSDAEVNNVDNTPEKKRLAALQEGLQRLNALPSPKSMAKQNAADRVGLLQRRLEALKMMLLHASPEQAKALARELKSIAGELSSAAKALGSGAGMSAQGAQAAPGNITPLVNADAEAGVDTAAGVSAEASISSSDAESASSIQDAEAKSDAPSSDDKAAVSNAPQRSANSDEMDSAVLRGLVKDAKNMLKSVIEALKRKLAEGDKEGKKDVQEAEKMLASIGDSLQQSSSANTYTGTGGLAMDAAAINSVAASGINISITA